MPSLRELIAAHQRWLDQVEADTGAGPKIRRPKSKHPKKRSACSVCGVEVYAELLTHVNGGGMACRNCYERAINVDRIKASDGFRVVMRWWGEESMTLTFAEAVDDAIDDGRLLDDGTPNDAHRCEVCGIACRSAIEASQCCPGATPGGGSLDWRGIGKALDFICQDGE